MNFKTPKGAILHPWDLPVEGPIWKASREFSSIIEYVATGVFGTEINSYGSAYYYVEYHCGDRSHLSRMSALDMNIGGLNNYNDWFWFSNRADALAHSRVKEAA